MNAYADDPAANALAPDGSALPSRISWGAAAVLGARRGTREWAALRAAPRVAPRSA